MNQFLFPVKSSGKCRFSYNLGGIVVHYFIQTRLTHSRAKLSSYRKQSVICSANQLTGFYMKATLAFNELTLEITFRDELLAKCGYK